MSLHRMRAGTLVALAIGAVVAAPAACLFPSYVFDLPGTGGTGGAGGTASSTTSSRTSSTSASTTTTTTTVSSTTSTTSSTTGSGGGAGTGGMLTTSSTVASSVSSSTTSTTSSTTSSSGGTCATVDCSDPACTPTHSCVAATPAGWTGYFSLYDGAPAGDPGCPAKFPVSAYIGNAQLNAPAPVCSACGCGSPQGEMCTYSGTFDVVDVTCGNLPFCGSKLAVPATWDGTCYGPDGSPPSVNTCGVNSGAMCNMGTAPCNKSVQAGALTVVGGACTPSPEVAVVASITWGSAGEACGGAPNITKGCNPGLTCLPKPQAPFQAGVCIQKGGDNACPPGQFLQKHLFYQSASDTRACSPCSCGAPSGSTCNATATLYSSPQVNTCNAGMLAASLNLSTAGSACVNIANNVGVGSRKAVFTAPAGGGCSASGGQPMGTATPQSPTTFCCIP